MSDLIKLRHQSALDLQGQLSQAKEATKNAEVALAAMQKELDSVRAMYQSSLVQ
jgi:hypothetical protein